MMYQLLQLCIELRLGEEQSLGLLSLASTIAEIFGRNFPPDALLPHNTSSAGHSADPHSSSTFVPGHPSFSSSAQQSLSRSPRRTDFTLPPSIYTSGGGLGMSLGSIMHGGNSGGGGSLVGLSHNLSLCQSELQQVDAMQQQLRQEAEGQSQLIEKLTKSRSKHLHREQQLQQELRAAQETVEAEQHSSKKLQNALKRAETRLK